VVIGAGYIGIEMAENLAHIGLEVDVVELADHIIGPLDAEMAALLTPVLSAHGVGLHLSDGIASAKDTGCGVTVTLKSGKEITADFAVLGIGVKPETKLATSAGLKIGSTGGIAVDKSMRTSDPAIFAVGDAVEVTDYISGEPARIPLAGPANRQGRMAADNIAGRVSEYRDTLGTAVIKVFDWAAAMVGNNERQLKARGVDYEKVYTHSGSHAGYYPGAKPLSFKLLFEKPSGRLLGAQAIGIEGVDKRIDVVATAIRGGMTVFDLEHLELCYAPPFSSAKDPVNVVGFVAANHLNGDMPIVHWHDFETRDRGKTFLLDVRTAAEYAAGTIEDAVNIPVDSLRKNLDKLPRDREIWVICQVGLRGHVATRMLLQRGFTARNLTGGYKTWKTATSCAPAAPARAPMACGAEAAETTNDNGEIRHIIDARGQQCPGPIMTTFKALEQARGGELVKVLATDPGYSADIGAWCSRTGNTLVSNEYSDGAYVALIRKGTEAAAAGSPAPATGTDKTIIVFSQDLDKVLAAFVIANGAAAMGRKVTMFFTFWGLNALRKHNRVKVKKDVFGGMFGAMMPRGAKRLGISKMNMAGIGPRMIRFMMGKKNVASLEDFIGQALSTGVRIIACTMSMDVMGLRKEEFIDGVEVAGVASYLAAAETSDTNLFI
jgi:peroxiredoxin family protein/TusA-related sulfurtransferase/rhodanese-related sulfurtransferase